jgi:hypothetical protein
MKYGLNIYQNVTAQWLAFLLRNLEVSDSNLCPETGYPD